MNHTRFKIGFLLLLLVVSASSSYGREADDYKVYDAVVRYMFRDGITRFDMNAKVDRIVFRDRTYSEYAWDTQKENWSQVKIRISSLTDEIIADYESVRKSEADLKEKFDIPLKYTLIADKKLRKLIPHPNGAMEHWNEYYKLYPKSAGYNSFSRVGYDKSGRTALVYFVNWCGSLCGTGNYVLVEKSEGGWKVKEAAPMWIS